MHDPNRDQDRGDPNVDQTPDEVTSVRQSVPREPAIPPEQDRGSEWTASNPGLTGDATPADAPGTRVAGSGAERPLDPPEGGERESGSGS